MAMGRTLRSEERVGLAVAFGLHLLIVLAFLLQPTRREAIEPTQRMTVNLASDVGMEATAPDPVPESRAAIAPTLADTPAPAPVEAAVQPQPQPQPQPVPQPRLERPVASKQPAPADTRPRRRPDTPSVTPPKPATRGGGSRVGDNFLAGMGDSARTSETRAPASSIGASAKASLLQAIVREVKPHWQPPSGPDVDQLVSKIRFRLNPDGSLAGRPQVVGQRGENATNQAQAGRHGEQAIRAVQLAAPFDLPDEYYAAWKTVTLDFDWKLAQ